MLFAALGLVVATFSPQETQPAPAIGGTSPAECLASIRAFVAMRQKAAGRITGDLIRQIDEEKRVGARACAAPFDGATIAEKDLVALVELYTEAAQPELAKTALDRAMALRTLPEPGRAAVLRTAIRTGLREPKSEARNARLEALIDELDRLSPAVIDEKIAAHSLMNGYYRGDDIDAGIVRHSTWLIDAAKGFSPDDRKKYGYSIVSAHVNMAEAWAGHGRTDDALALLRRGRADWAETPSVARAIDPVIARYELIGTAAAPIAGTRWLNASDGTTTLDMKGAVTLLEFTAHWCGPCKESYPGITRLRERYGSRGFRVVLATELYGYFEKEQNLSAEDEIARDRTYFASHHMAVPIAINDRPAPVVVDGRPVYKQEANSKAYRVGGIPQIHLIDRQGRIRLIMVGYDDGNEPQLARLIEELLGDKTVER